MRARYGPWTLGGDIQVGWSWCFMWKEICVHAAEIVPHVRWLIGDGQSADFFFL